MLQDEIIKLGEYFRGIEYYNDAIIVKVNFPIRWLVYPSANGFIKPDEFMYNEDKQFIFEGILYSGLNLYNNGSPSKSKVAESRKRFIREIEQKNEEKFGDKRRML